MRLTVLMYVYEQVLRRVQWKGQKDWLLSSSGTWAQDGKPAGFVRAHQNLEYLIGTASVTLIVVSLLWLHVY
jgi:hypothetical protein